MQVLLSPGQQRVFDGRAESALGVLVFGDRDPPPISSAAAASVSVSTGLTE